MEAMTHHKDHASQTPSCWNLISKRRFRRRHQQDPPQKQSSDGSQTMSTKNNRSTSEIWWTSTNNGQSQIPQNWEKNQTINHYKAQHHHMSIWVHIRDTRRYLSNKRLTASNTHLKTIKTCTKHRCSSLDPITHPIRNRRLRQILTARILRRQKSRRRNGKP